MPKVPPELFALLCARFDQGELSRALGREEWSVDLVRLLSPVEHTNPDAWFQSLVRFAEQRDELPELLAVMRTLRPKRAAEIDAVGRLLGAGAPHAQGAGEVRRAPAPKADPAPPAPKLNPAPGAREGQPGHVRKGVLQELGRSSCLRFCYPGAGVAEIHARPDGLASASSRERISGRHAVPRREGNQSEAGRATGVQIAP